MTASMALLYLLVEGFRMKNRCCQKECTTLNPSSKPLDSHMAGLKYPVYLDIANYDWDLGLICVIDKPNDYFQYWHTHDFQSQDKYLLLS